MALARGVWDGGCAFRIYRRLAPQQRVDGDVAFILDGAHDRGVLTTYVTQAHERRALAAAGFAVRAVIAPDGSVAAADSRARGIPCHLHASHVRTLLAFFGPFAPVIVMVPAALGDTARAKLDDVLRAPRSTVPPARAQRSARDVA